MTSVKPWWVFQLFSLPPVLNLLFPMHFCRNKVEINHQFEMMKSKEMICLLKISTQYCSRRGHCRLFDIIINSTPSKSHVYLWSFMFMKSLDISVSWTFIQIAYKKSTLKLLHFFKYFRRRTVYLRSISIDVFERFSSKRVIVRIDANVNHVTDGHVTPVAVFTRHVEMLQCHVWIPDIPGENHNSYMRSQPGTSLQDSGRRGFNLTDKQVSRSY